MAPTSSSLSRTPIQIAGGIYSSLITSWATLNTHSSCRKRAITEMELETRSQLPNLRTVIKKRLEEVEISRLLWIKVLSTRASRTTPAYRCRRVQWKSASLESRRIAVSTTWRFAQVTSIIALFARWREPQVDISSGRLIILNSKSFKMLRCSSHIL